MIEFARTHIISRGAGHSAIAAAAYRSGTDMYDDRTGLTHKYSVRAEEVAHSEILLPEGAPEYFKDRADFWAAAELAEDASTRRSTAQLAKDHIIALPRELPLTQQIEMIREFAQSHLVDHGVAVDLNVHLHSKDNPHAHLMTTTRVIDEYGFGKKARHLNGGFYGGKKVTDEQQMRHSWAAFQNKWCEQRGIDLTVTNNDGQWLATRHIGRQIEKTDHNQPELVQVNDQLTLDRQKQIINNPLSLVDRITRNKAVFTRKDLQGELFRHITDKETYDKGMKALDRILTEKTGLVSIGVVDDEMRYTSSDNLQAEIELADTANSMLESAPQFGCSDSKREKIIVKDYSFFSDEQKAAVKHISQDNRLSVVVGLAGAGKSTMLKAANELWKEEGLNVQGVALAGIAASGLQEGSGIESRTLASWQYAMKDGKVELDDKSVVVMDEAGMVGNKMMLDVVQRIQKAGAKLVLVGDPEQLQSINAGGPLRSVMQRAGYCEIGIVRRQQDAWQRDATKDLAEGRTTQALNSYDENGNVHWSQDKSTTLQKLANDTVSDILARKHTAVLAHTNSAVDELNSIIRQQLIDKDHLKSEGKPFISARGKILLTKGDRVLFRKNDRQIGVQNGSVGTITSYDSGRMQVKLDNGETVRFNGAEYDSLAHGYAMTIHKSQGVTVDHTRVLASGGYDKHLSYVALSRHRKSTDIYAALPEFQRQKKGKETNNQTFQRIMGRVQIEENAIDFANRHGLELIQDGTGFQMDRTDEKSAVAKIVEQTNKHYKELIQPIQSRENRLIENVAALADQVVLAKRTPATLEDADLGKLREQLSNAKAALKTHRTKRVESGGLNIKTWETANKMAHDQNPKQAAIVKAAEVSARRGSREPEVRGRGR